MSLLFADSFDHYTNILSKWASKGDNTIISSGARTGTSCLSINSAAFGPATFFAHLQDVLGATAYNCSQSGLAMRLLQLDINNGVVELFINGDGSLAVRNVIGGTVYGTTAAALYQFNTYNSLALRCFVSATVGQIWLWVNGALVMHLTGLNTENPNNPGSDFINGFQPMGPGGIPAQCLHDDVYVLNCTDSIHNTFLGALRIYAGTPTSNGSPTSWVSSGGFNWANVAEIPPDDDTSYNSADTTGQTDQYIHPLPGAVPGNSQLVAVQHCQDLRVSSGSLNVTSDIAGTLSGSTKALTAGYVIYHWPYDTYPPGGGPWSAADFPLAAGPSVTL